MFDPMVTCVEDPPVFNSIEKTYISSKVAHIKWKPDGDYFVTGTYSELKNNVELWHYPNGCEESTGIPVVKSNLPVIGDVTGLQFVDKNKFMICTTHGELQLVEANENKLKVLESWTKDSFVGDSLNGLDVCEHGMVAVLTSGGQIACFSYLNAKEPTFLCGFSKDKSKCISFLTRHTLAHANIRGQISIWDLREDGFSPSMTFPYNSDISVGVTSLKPFPVQRHMLVASGLDGSLTTWDLRNYQTSQTIYGAHRKPVSSLVFHPDRPSNAFTTSFSGEVWHWANFHELLGGQTVSEGPLLFGQQVAGFGEVKPDVRCLIGFKKFATNSCDVINDRLVCSTDNDCLIFVKPLQLK